MILNNGKVKFKKKFGSKFKNKARKKIDDFTFAPCINMPEGNDKAKQIVFIILFAIGKKEINLKAQMPFNVTIVQKISFICSRIL